MLEKVRLGRTGLMVTRVSMGCLPIQRLSKNDAVALLRYAFDRGINFYDTAHVYTDSEEKIGAAFPGAKRREVIIASKTMSDTYDKTMSQIDESLRRLGTDYVDLYQWHNPENIDGFLEAHGPYQAMLDAKKAGKIRFIGMTNHHFGRAQSTIDSGAFDTLQFPMSVLSSPEEVAMSERCRDHDMGFIAMKAMCGGLLLDGRLPFTFLNQYPHIVPIWGVDAKEQLDQFLDLAASPEPFTETMRGEVEALRAEYGDAYCRGCGYCEPCPAGINLHMMMRIMFFIKRNPAGSQFGAARYEEVQRIKECTECRACMERCPYHLEIPEALKAQFDGYMKLYNEYRARVGESG